MQSKNWHMDVIEMNGVRLKGRQAKNMTYTVCIVMQCVIFYQKRWKVVQCFYSTVCILTDNRKRSVINFEIQCFSRKQYEFGFNVYNKIKDVAPS